MRTDRRDALGARRFDAQQMAAVGMAGPGLDLDGFARQRVGHVERPRRRVGDAVAAMAELIDDRRSVMSCSGRARSGQSRDGRQIAARVSTWKRQISSTA